VRPKRVVRGDRRVIEGARFVVFHAVRRVSSPHPFGSLEVWPPLP